MRPADFRSDTVTKPSRAMREAMAGAEVGDDVLDGDPTVLELEAAGADFLGKERAVYVPSGTMANQAALGAWTRPGDEILVHRAAHVVTYEAGAAGWLHGVQALAIGDADGRLTADEVRAAIRPDYYHTPNTTLLCLEQTHQGAGGRVAPIDELEEVSAVAREAGVPIHMDGARLANAAVASGIRAARWAETADSVSICLSKGLGAPVGSLVAGSADFIERARLVRKRLGGWMRQAGVIAAGGLFALRHNVERLAEDHSLARDLAVRLDRLPGLSCPADRVDTNIVPVRVREANAPALASALAERGVLVLAFAPDLLRFVTHMDVGVDDVERAEQALAALCLSD